MDSTFRWLASPAGRAARITAGAVLIGIGLIPRRKNWGLAALGTIPLSMGAGDFYPLALLYHLPFKGRKLRDELGVPRQ